MKPVTTMKFLPCHISSEQILSEEACKNLIEKYDTKAMPAGITTKGFKNPTVRKAFSRSISLEDNIDVNDCITECYLTNNKYWGYETLGKAEIKFLKYNTGGHYDWHIDIGSHRHNNRKLAFVIPLSKPDEYEGGELIIKTSSRESSIPLEQGKIIMFPAFLLHKVTPVTHGKRYVIAGWLNGKNHFA
tara:strand:- start:28 stop:591 length:564 start_codon:yes stop_codon:yes gene_type:complete